MITTGHIVFLLKLLPKTMPKELGRFFLFNSRYANYVLFFFLFMMLTVNGVAQKVSIKILALQPDWNTKEVCDNGTGYRVSPINAPSINYSGSPIKDAMYNYVWEQKINDGDWQEVASAKNTTAIKSYNPKVLYNSKAGSAIAHYSWRLVITDIANGNQTVESEVFTLHLGSPMEINYTIQPKADKNLYNLQTTVTGGFPNKSFTWKSLNNKNLPSSQLQVEDPEGLSAGEYEVEVSDGCSTISKKINTSTSNTN